MKKCLTLVLALLMAMQWMTIPVLAEETAESQVQTEQSQTPEATVPAPEVPEDMTEPPVEETVAETQPEETLPEESEPVLPEPETIMDSIALVTEQVIVEAEQPKEEDWDALRNQIPNYFQTDYPNQRYGAGTVASSGCSITSLAMVATYMTGHPYMPDELADYFGGRAYSNMDRLETASRMLQLPFHKSENWHESLKALREGKVVIALVEKESIFTESQHFIVLTEMTDDGKIWVNDPYQPNYRNTTLKKGFENGFDQKDILKGYSGGWIYNKSAMPAEPFIYEEEKIVVPCRYPDFGFTEAEMDLLAKVVWVESQGESMEGQQAVAEVVLNRLVSDRFSNTLAGVIYGENQFRSVPYLEDATPWQTQYEAIENAMYGPYVLPEDVYYFARKPTNKNVWSRIGGHVFCYADD